MGCELLSRYQVYRQNLVEAGQYLRSLGCEWDLLGKLPTIRDGEDTNRLISRQ